MDGIYDVVVIGGGAAGLNGALMLARSRRSVLVVDAGEPRNAPAGGVHGLLGRDGMPPAELLTLGRAEVRSYGGQVEAGTVEAVSGSSGRFTVSLADGRTVAARRLLVTTGLVDELPELPGLRELWGRDVVHCPYCHGWEVRDRPIGILATGPQTLHQALLFRQLSDDVVVFARLAAPARPAGSATSSVAVPATSSATTRVADPAAIPATPLLADEREQLAARAIRVVDEPVAAVEVVDGALTGVRLVDGTVVPRRALAVSTRMTARAGFLEAVGLHAVDHPSGVAQHVPVDQTGRTQVPGIWAAGNVADPFAQVGAAAAAGAFAAAHINADLVGEQTRIAVDAARATSTVPA